MQTGIARTGTLFAFEQEGVQPDVLTLAKGLGGGLPLAALLASHATCCFEPGEQGGTFCGTPLMTAVGLAVLRQITKPGFLPRVNRRATDLRRVLEEIAVTYRCPEVRGRGLLQAIVLPEPIATDIVVWCREHGLLLNSPAPSVLRFLPALNVRRNEIKEMATLLIAALRALLPG